MIFTQTFCEFDVFINNQMIYFPSKKARELLAILVGKRGGSVTISQLTYMLYEEVPEITAKKNIRVFAHRLRRILKEHECEELLIRRRGIYSVNTQSFTCDLYELLSGNKTYMAAYTGNCTSEYVWAAQTVPYLNVVYGNYYDKETPPGNQ